MMRTDDQELTTDDRSEGKGPSTAGDVVELPVIEPLNGDKDISLPVADVEGCVGSPDDWLIARGYPLALRPGGWVYLRHNGVLAARVRVLAMVWRESRIWRTGDVGTEAGPGLAFEIDRATWERCEFELGELAGSQRQGYRYLITSADGERIAHLSVDEAVPVDFVDLAGSIQVPPEGQGTEWAEVVARTRAERAKGPTPTA